MAANSPFLNLESRRWAWEAQKENTSRSASYTYRFQTNGGGSIVLPGVIQFPAQFMERPTISTGVSLLGAVAPNGALPQVTVLVIEWQTDSRDFYIGCKVAVRVDTTVSYPLEHDLRFEGRAIKVPTSTYLT